MPGNKALPVAILRPWASKMLDIWISNLDRVIGDYMRVNRNISYFVEFRAQFPLSEKATFSFSKPFN